MHRDEHAEEGGLREDVGERAQAGEFFLLENQPFAGDLARGVIRAHQREQDDLKHDQPGDEAAGVHAVELLHDFALHLLDDIAADRRGEAFHLRQAIQREDDDEERETQRAARGAGRIGRGRAGRAASGGG